MDKWVNVMYVFYTSIKSTQGSSMQMCANIRPNMSHIFMCTLHTEYTEMVLAEYVYTEKYVRMYADKYICTAVKHTVNSLH